MPRPPSADTTTPLYHCLRCHQTLTYHNMRTEQNADGANITVTVYLCIHHGFFQVTNSKPLQAGM